MASEIDNAFPAAVQAVAIEGMGVEGSKGADNGILFVSSGAEEYQELISGWDVWPYLRADDTETKGHQSEFFSQDVSYSAANLRFRAEKKLIEKFEGTAEFAVAELTSDMSDSATTMETDNPNLEGVPVWVDDEVVVPGNHDGAGDYSSVDRGVYSTEFQHHSTNANIYDRFPEKTWGRRKVRLFTLLWLGGPTQDPVSGDPTGQFAKIKRWEGETSGGPAKSGGAMQLKTTGPLVELEGDQYGRESRTFERQPRIKIWRDVDEGYTFAASNGSAEYQSKVFKPDDQVRWNYFQVAGEIVRGEVRYTAGGTAEVEINSPPLFGRSYESQFGSDEYQKKIDSSKVYEVLSVQRDGPIDDTFVNLTSSMEEFFRWHPLTYYAAFMFSTNNPSSTNAGFDWLRPDWSCQALDNFQPNILSKIKSLIRETPQLTIDHFVLGLDGSPVNLRDFCRNILLEPWGFKEAPTKNGELDIVLSEGIGVQEFEDAQNNKIIPEVSDVIDQDSGRRKTISAVRIDVGSLPHAQDSGESEVILADDDDQSKAAYSRKDPDVTYDFRTVKEERRAEIGRFIQDRVLAGAIKLPRFQFELEDWWLNSNDYSVGKVAALDDIPIEPGWATNRSGNVVQDFGSDAEWVGIFQNLRWLPQRNAYVAELLFASGDLERWRAPSGVIQSTTTDNSGNRILTLEGEGGEASYWRYRNADSSYFTVGDEVEIFQPYGARWSSNAIKEIIDVDANNHTIKVSGDWPSAPTPKQRVELAYPDTDGSGTGYENDGLNGRFSSVDRIYVILADSSDTSGDAQLDADVYGI